MWRIFPALAFALCAGPARADDAKLLTALRDVLRDRNYVMVEDNGVIRITVYRFGTVAPGASAPPVPPLNGYLPR